MAKNVNIAGGGGGGVGSDELTSLLSDVVKGKTAVTSDSNDDPGVGTLELTGNAVAAHVLTGESFYTTDPKNKIVGAMIVNSVLSFSVAAYSGRRVLLKWQNPYAAPGRPYCGVIIKWRSGSYPPVEGLDGTFEGVYVGVGSSTTPGGWSEVYVDMPNLNTTYYFTLTTYATTNLGHDLYSHGYGDPNSPMHATCTTAATSIIQITYTQNYTVPLGFTSADIFCVGGGGGGGAGYRFTDIAYEQGGGGGGGGYTATALNIGVAAGQIMNCVIGNGGGQNTSINGPGGTGGTTSVSRGGIVLCTANGGKGGDGASGASGGYGGSRGGSGGYNDLGSRPVINAGGNGYADGAGTGSQGYTTRAFGEAGNTLYAGGGGGGGVSRSNPGAGGAGGGGAGGAHNGTGNAGAANTGGGGGGGGGAVYGTAIAGGTGGSGVILIRLK